MKIGVVCEGMTDFHAISHYVGAALQSNGIPTEFIALQPLPDNTSGGGWGNVFSWLDKNPPAIRAQLFGRGLFANSKNLSELDSIVIHLDTDIFPDQSFLNFLKTRKFQISPAASIEEKSAEVSRVIFHFANLHECSVEHARKHVAAPIAESSEAWCVAVDSEFLGMAESLSGQDLIDAFGVSFARFNKISPRERYSSINKKVKSRENYCRNTAGRVERLSVCTQFVLLVKNLTLVASPPQES